MKFFTRGWVHGDMTDEEQEAVKSAYWRGVEGMGLPPSVRGLAELNPHDRYILGVDHDVGLRTLQLRIRCGDLQAGYFDALLVYSGVTISPEHLARLVEARRPAEVEILYDEVDRGGAGDFVYRLLLNPVGEVSIRFGDVGGGRRPVAGRQAK